MLLYDEQTLITELDQLSRKARVAFAATCAERLTLASFRFSKTTNCCDAKILESALERLWQDLSGTAMLTENELKEILEACTQLLAAQDEAQQQIAVEDAISAVMYSIRCRQGGEAQESAWAARRVYEALDEFVICKDHIDTNLPGSEQRVLVHPLIQAELARQRRDLNELRTQRNEMLIHFRNRAQAEAATVFG